MTGSTAAVQRRRGTAAANAAFTGLSGEITVDTDNNRLVLHDGVTEGGWPAAKLSETQSKSGTTTNDNAAAGNVGEYLKQSLAPANAVALTSATPANVLALTLSAGDWDVSGTVGWVLAGTTVVSQAQAAIGLASPAALPTQPNGGAFVSWYGSLTGVLGTMPVGLTRISLASATTIYLVAQASFTSSTLAAFGFLGARRAR